ncbi:hypothetical protein [Oceanobacillus iheyensis HTE831]|uniref:DUF998 domain-containing protein n=2 Tax=Oceanobacillus iheyensis TaxID=182710 RepID=Q8ERM2_OCEIH|nr:hypothetical protein [Oceanobacillus iheyensis HTE831]
MGSLFLYENIKRNKGYKYRNNTIEIFLDRETLSLDITALLSGINIEGVIEMKISKKVGITSWILTCMYFVLEPFFVMSSIAPYNVMDHAMSDLGVTSCGEYTYSLAAYDICSPHHFWMNVLFIVNGITFSIGIVYLSQQLERNRKNLIGTICLLLLAIGNIFSGFIPADVNLFWHSIFAQLGMVTFLIGLWLFGKLLVRGKWWTYGILVSLVVLVIFILLLIFIPLPAGLLQRMFYAITFLWGTVLAIILSDHKGAYR